MEKEWLKLLQRGTYLALLLAEHSGLSRHFKAYEGIGMMSGKLVLTQASGTGFGGNIDYHSSKQLSFRSRPSSSIHPCIVSGLLKYYIIPLPRAELHKLVVHA